MFSNRALAYAGRIGRPVAIAAVVAIAGATLTGCGGDDKKSGDSTPEASRSGNPIPSSEPTTLPEATAPGDVKTTTTTTRLPVPSGGPQRIRDFPVPRGVRVNGPGPMDESWQFDITAKDTESVLEFYRTTLAREGYTLRNDVVDTVGIEKIHYDIEFTGKARGYVIADPKNDDVFVNVEKMPTGN